MILWNHPSSCCCEGVLDGADMVVVQCGMGKVNAGINATTMSHYKPKAFAHSAP